MVVSARADLADWRHADEKLQKKVLSLARRAFDEFVQKRIIINPPSDLPSIFQKRIGVFVSAMRGGAPRCCMGTIYPTEGTTAREIIAAVAMAAGRDRRFPAVRPGELKDLILIVSFVDNPRPITEKDLLTLDPTRDGLMVKNGDRSGVVLSGETDRVERMIQWARIRAGVSENEPVELFRLDVVRFVER
jgi:hypothetical protein